ncbi:hypothetical protein Tco_1287425 [Tanacetum coccineum]
MISEFLMADHEQKSQEHKRIIVHLSRSLIGRKDSEVYRELVREFLALFEFDASPCRYDPENLGVKFRLGGALSVEPLFDVFKKNSLIAIGVVMELQNGACFWPVTREVEEDDEAEEAAEGEVGNEGVGGSADIYRNLSQGD